MLMQVVKKGGVQLQNRLVPDGPVHDWVRRIDDLQPDIDRVLQVRTTALPCPALCRAAHLHARQALLFAYVVLCISFEADQSDTSTLQDPSSG